MKAKSIEKILKWSPSHQMVAVGVLIVAFLCPFNIFSDNQRRPVRPTLDPNRRYTTLPDSIPVNHLEGNDAEVVNDEFILTGDSMQILSTDTIAVVNAPTEVEDQTYTFNPDPNRAVWLSVLCPGLGQLYNRRYWKLPIVVGGFMGLGYATSWNNNMLSDYTRAYSHLLDNDPTTNSYMDFFPPTTQEADLDKTWLENIFKSRKDYYRRNRDLCIICMVAVYLIAIVDAYVDATLTHFDISPDLSMQVSPALIQDSRNRLPALGMQWALNF